MKFFFSGFLEIFSGYFFNPQIWPLTGWSQHLFCHGALRAEGLGGSRQTPPLGRGECQTHLPPASLTTYTFRDSSLLFHIPLSPDTEPHSCSTGETGEGVKRSPGPSTDWESHRPSKQSGRIHEHGHSIVLDQPSGPNRGTPPTSVP